MRKEARDWQRWIDLLPTDQLNNWKLNLEPEDFARLQNIEIIQPAVFNPDFVDFVKEKELLTPFQILVNFVNKPIVIDNFNEHQERRIWKKKITGKYNELALLFKNNKLTLNTQNFLSLVIPFIKDLCDRLELTEEQRAAIVFLDEVDKLLKKADQYDLLPLEDKIEQVKKMDVSVRSFLTAFLKK